MAQVNLLWVCLVAFAITLVLLSVLAGALRLLTTLFPEKPQAMLAVAPAPAGQLSSVDAAMAAAIASSVSASIPGARVTHIDEPRGD